MSSTEGKRYAVLVGCNYGGTKNELYGCINDVIRMRHTLMTRFAFPTQNIEMLIDSDPSFTEPNGQNIMAALKSMIGPAQSGDLLFFHYSGHGTLVPRRHTSAAQQSSGGGVGEYDECIVPCDLNLISAEDMREVVNKLPPGVSFTMVSDSCHSGGLIDQEKEQIGPHCRIKADRDRNSCRRGRSRFLAVEHIRERLQAAADEHLGDALHRLFGKSVASHSLKRVGGLEANAKAKANSEAEEKDMAVLLSGCQSDETCEDVCPSDNPEESFGAFSDALQKSLMEHEHENETAISHRHLVLRARQLLVEQGYSQHPCLYCSDINADAPFLSPPHHHRL